MAIQIPKFGRAAAFVLVTQFNALKREINAALSSPKVHADVTSKVSSPDPDAPTVTADVITAVAGDGTLPTLLANCANIQATYLRHITDKVAHKTAETAPALTTATDLTSAIALLNAVKADFNTHIASTTYHYAADGTNTIATADATNQASADTLAGSIKTAFNAHIVLALQTASITLV